MKKKIFVSPRRPQIFGRFQEGQHVEHMETSSSSEPSSNTALIQRQGRSERRCLANKHVCYYPHSLELQNQKNMYRIYGFEFVFYNDLYTLSILDISDMELITILYL